MKTELRLRQHRHWERSKEQAIEVWFNGEFIAAVYGADGPGIRIISKYVLREASIDVQTITPPPYLFEVDIIKV